MPLKDKIIGGVILGYIVISVIFTTFFLFTLVLTGGDAKAEFTDIERVINLTAAEFGSGGYDSCGPTASKPACGQEFTATSTFWNLAKIDFSAFYYNSTNEADTINYAICKGEINNSTWSSSYNCQGTANEVATGSFSGSIVTTNSSSNTHDTFFTMDIPDLELTIGQKYYIAVWPSGGTTPQLNFGKLADVYSDNTSAFGYTNGYDHEIKLYKENYFGMSQETANTEASYYDLNDLYLPTKKTCYVGQSCKIPVQYNPTTYNGYQFDFWYKNDYSEAIASTTINSFLSTPYYLKWYAEMPTGTTTAELLVDFSTYKNDGDYNLLVEDIKIDYLSATSTLKEVWDNLPSYDIETACDGVATSSGSYADDFRYGMECAFRKALYWSFTPSDEVYTKFLVSYQDMLEEDFPFTLYTNFKKVLNSIATSTMSDTNSINLGDFPGFDEHENADEAKLMYGEIIEDHIGEETYDTIKTFWELVIFGIVIIYIYHDLTAKAEEDNL